MIIEKGIPLPGGASGKQVVELNIPFEDMQPGDSVYISKSDCRSKNLAVLVKVRANRYGSQNKKKFLTRKDEGGVRLWRSE